MKGRLDRARACFARLINSLASLERAKEGRK